MARANGHDTQPIVADGHEVVAIHRQLRELKEGAVQDREEWRGGLLSVRRSVDRRSGWAAVVAAILAVGLVLMLIQAVYLTGQLSKIETIHQVQSGR